MKNSKTLLVLLTGAFVATAAYAQVEITITGSTAFRSISLDRGATLFDAGSFTGVTNNASAGLQTYSGTMSNKIGSLGNTPVKMRFSFSGSASGMLAVKNQTPVSTAETPGVNVNKTPDLAFSDVFPSSATPPISDSAFNRNVVGVVPFAFVRNNGMTGVGNITRDQALLLMTASGKIGGIDGMPATYLGGSSTAPIYFIGRDPGSGTRITVHKVIGFNGTPTLWATNGPGNYVLTNGYSSGSNVRDVLRGKADAIGYLGIGDYQNIAASATTVSYDGVPFSTANVQNGSYAVWGYQHLVNRAGGLSANQTAVRNALIAAITDQTFQTTNPLYTLSFVDQVNMTVERGTDGGPITSLNF
jgi:hypothetical protein